MEIGLPLLKALGALVIILAGCELFTNGIEWFGSKLHLSKGVVGSVLAAVGTALPETLVPVVAIVLVGGDSAQEIGIGAILGAPFMLATLAAFVTGLSVVMFANRRPSGAGMAVDESTVSQDLVYFLTVYTVAVGTSLVLPLLEPYSATLPYLGSLFRGLVVVFLVGAYVYYVWLHLRREEDQGEEELRALYLQSGCAGNPRLRFIISQVFIALVAIILGAHLFVQNLEHVAKAVSISPLVLSLIVTPIATELPEKFNSILWVRQGKDTLAIGNITGAMVFQSCIPAGIGIALTPWALDVPALASAVIALASGLIVYVNLRVSRRLSPVVLMLGLPLYLVFLFVAFHGR